MLPDLRTGSWDMKSEQPPIQLPTVRASTVQTIKPKDKTQSVVEPYALSPAYFNHGSLSETQTQSATRVFVSVLQEDQALMSLYESLRNRSDITPRQLQEHIRLSMKTFAKNLSEEAKGFVDISVSSLNDLANRATECLAGGECDTDTQDQTEFAEIKTSDESSGQLARWPRFVNLYDLRILMTHSNAIRVLRAEANFFCKTESIRPNHGGRRRLTWREWREEIRDLAVGMISGLKLTFISKAALLLMMDAFFLVTDDLFIAMGYLEPPLEAGWTRIRSQCCRGSQYVDDVVEQCEGGAAALVERMQHTSSNLKIMIASSGSRSSAQKYTFRIPTWTRNLSSRLPVMSLWHREQPTALPHHSSNGAAISGTRSAGIIDEKQTWIYDLIPKRLHNKLTGYTDKPSEGWGLYFEEGWDVDSMVTISFILFVVASLLFGICYSVLE
ncbi:hypothetical protein AA0119_g1500 [Alternaria tenuissima]|uniref:Uncharacterized protein n=1 Tax=Alternaria tenuissima TaxID=119927 RepID=A0ABY0GN72_9PLEO|nr:hypothetical protein AA0119_g1500 [Alternaria tenuissima]